MKAGPTNPRARSYLRRANRRVWTERDYETARDLLAARCAFIAARVKPGSFDDCIVDRLEAEYVAAYVAHNGPGKVTA